MLVESPHLGGFTRPLGKGLAAADGELLDELVIDSFAGGGGTSEGIVEALGRDPDYAINHDRFALAMHRINHPNTIHLVEDVVTLDSVSLCDGRPIGMVWMSPDCKDHSKAKGGKPRDKNIRGLAWAVFGWVKALPEWQRPRVVFLENVEEFQEWSPLRSDGKRCSERLGVIFDQFIGSWRALGYRKIEWRERKAWRSGAGTTRNRLYIIMRRDNEPIVWPEPTRGDPNSEADAALIAAGQLRPWVTAADNIDFSLPCPSIFDTAEEIKRKHGVRAKRPLVVNTMARIAKGTGRHVIRNARPFIVPITHSGPPRVNSIDEPLRTITTAHRGEHAMVMPFVTKFQSGSVGHSIAEPFHTITAHASDTHGGGAAPIGVVAAFIAQHSAGSHPGAPSRAADEPLSTVMGTGSQQSLVTAHMLTLRGSDRRDASADEPMRTVSAGGTHIAAVLGFLAKYYGEGLPSQACDEPLHTLTAKPRFGFVEALAAAPPFGPEHWARARQVAEFLRAHGHWDGGEFVTIVVDGVTLVILDLGMRMLTARERFNAQGFRRSYIIDRGILDDGTEIKFTAEQQGYMCGNSVCPPEAAALIRANYRPRKVMRPRRNAPAPMPLWMEAAE